jgi:NAD(P)H-hydrate repair Nnr-like enzyme with NAD(P)H-hydrate dehydratase domain
MLLLPEATEVLRDRRTPTVLTPHEGEFRRMRFGYGGDPFRFNPKDRLMGVRDAAETLGVTMLLKGPTTIVANPDGRALFVTSGSPALATAGTGDVLSGVIGAFLAAGVEPLEAAAAAAHVHGRAAALGLRRGLVATDLPELVARWLSDNLAVPE